ncbi:MAG: flagellar type III secretion system pore protein FliP [Clostridiales bacterium]|nr:flagellar type III secretion system pore protein FliP [Clostridiales bacterium]MCF8021710.1 flagellar type III secretion system pore protein FliP [Clostridiales bacterium]
MKNKVLLVTILTAITTFFILVHSAGAEPLPGVNLQVSPTDEPQQVVDSVKLLVMLTLLSVLPGIILSMTSFTRIIVVLSLLRTALGTRQTPPNQVLIGLALFITVFLMAPVYNEVNEQAIQPYLDNQLNQEEAWDKAKDPVREFMLKQTRDKDLELFIELSDSPRPENVKDVKLFTLMPAFVISELKTAFQIGFLLYVPFLVIDMVVASTLMSMGMFMLPPVIISLPFKILLFVMIDGWHLVVKSLAESFT